MKDSVLEYVDDYAIIQTERVGTKEFYIGEKEESSSKEYISGTVNRKLSDLGIVQYSIDVQSHVYSDVLDYYYTHILDEVKRIQEEIADEPKGTVNRNDCHSIYNYETLKGKIIVLDKEVLLKEYQSVSHQLYLADDGFGCYPKGNGNAIFAYNLYTGKKTRIEKYDVLGVIKEEKLPEWAKEKREELKQKIKKSKESIR